MTIYKLTELDKLRYKIFIYVINKMGIKLTYLCLEKIINFDCADIFLSGRDIYNQDLIKQKLDNESEKPQEFHWYKHPFQNAENFQINRIILETLDRIGSGRRIYYNIGYIYQHIDPTSQIIFAKNLRIPIKFQKLIYEINIYLRDIRYESINRESFKCLRNLYQIHDNEIIPFYFLNQVGIFHWEQIRFEIVFINNVSRFNYLNDIAIHKHLTIDIYSIGNEFINKYKNINLLLLNNEIKDIPIYQVQYLGAIDCSSSNKIRKIPLMFNYPITHILISYPYDYNDEIHHSLSINRLFLLINGNKLEINLYKVKKISHFLIIPFIDSLPLDFNFFTDIKNQCLDFSRIETSYIEIHYEQLDINNFYVIVQAINLNVQREDNYSVKYLYSNRGMIWDTA